MRIASLFAALALTTTLHAAPQTLTFGVVEVSQQKANEIFAGITRQLNSTPELRVTLKSFTTYAQLYDAFKAHKVDLAYIGAVKYVEAHTEIGAVPIVTDGTVQSVLFVSAKSPIKSVAQLKGKKFAFGYEESTSTHLMPLLLLSKHQVSPTDLADRAFVGESQEAIIDAVSSGRYDAGAVVTPVFESHKTNLRALDTSETFPGAPVIVAKTADAKVVAKLRQLFLSYKPVGAESKQRFGHGVLPADDAAFNKVRFLVRVLFKKSYHS